MRLNQPADGLMFIGRWAFLIVVPLCLASCLSVPEVQPWEKGNLARQDMRFDVDRLDSMHQEHTYSSKEASAGGIGVSAGGCGCN